SGPRSAQKGVRPRLLSPLFSARRLSRDLTGIATALPAEAPLVQHLKDRRYSRDKTSRRGGIIRKVGIAVAVQLRTCCSDSQLCLQQENRTSRKQWRQRKLASRSSALALAG